MTPTDRHGPQGLGTTRHTWHHERLGTWFVFLHWAVVSERAECVAVDIRSYPGDEPEGRVRPVTNALLRMIPVLMFIDEDRRKRFGTLQTIIRLGEARPKRYRADREQGSFVYPSAKTTQRARRQSNLYAPTPVPRIGRPPLSAEELRQVADIYSEAWRRGDNPTQAVQAELRISRSGASKRIARARSEGFLTPTTKGKAGGATSAPKRKGKQ